MKAYFLVLSAVFTLASANEPQPPAAQPTAEQAAPVQAAPVQAAPVQAVTELKPESEVKPAVETAAITDAQIKQMRGRGYKPVKRNGTLVFCRSEGELGTHFERTRCNTIEELKQAELTGKEYVNSIQQQGSPTPFKGP
jgi:methionine-rich copper-binding protein CopC